MEGQEDYGIRLGGLDTSPLSSWPSFWLFPGPVELPSGSSFQGDETKSMAAAWTVEGSPLRDPGAASHATNTRMLPIGCARQNARNQSPDSDPTGCARQNPRNSSMNVLLVIPIDLPVKML